MIETALFALLSQNVGVASLLAEASSPIRYRIYPLLIPQHALDETTKQPCLVYTKTGLRRGVTMNSGTDTLAASSIQIDAYATSFLAAVNLANAVKSALLDYNGTVSSVRIKTANIDNEFAMDDPEPGLYRVSQAWTVWHVE